MKCEICGKICKGYSLGNHIVNSIDINHDISLKDYYDRYLKKIDEGICGACGKQTNFGSLTRGYSESCSKKCIARNPKVKLRIKQTLMENYGVDNASKSPLVQQKKIDTCRERYGVDHHWQNHIVQESKIQTCLDRHGVENISQLEKVKQQKISTLKENYGVEHPMYIPGMKDIVNEKKIRTCREKYGVENISQTLECREIFRDNMLNHLEDCKLNGLPLSPYIGYNEPNFFNELQKVITYIIIRPDRMYGFFPDGYIEELNLVIEFDEHWHQHEKHKHHDQIKDATYTKHNLSIFRVPQKEWEETPDIIKERFLQLIEQLEVKV